jgi:hypothetical protein
LTRASSEVRNPTLVTPSDYDRRRREKRERHLEVRLTGQKISEEISFIMLIYLSVICYGIISEYSSSTPHTEHSTQLSTPERTAEHSGEQRYCVLCVGTKNKTKTRKFSKFW